MKIILFLLCFFQVTDILGQRYELGDVSVKELQETRYEKDTSAPAAVIFKKAKTVFKYENKKGFVSYTEVALKIKIYKESGRDWANFKIPYYVGYEILDDESLAVSKAFTYNLENGKVIKEKVLSESKFSEDINEFWRTQTIVFPNVKSGSIIELKYVLRSQNLSVLPDFQFQYSIPVNYAEYQTEIPEFYIYKSIKNGLIPLEFKESLSNISIVLDSKDAVFCNQINSKYTARNIPALPKENFVPNFNNYCGKIELELQTIRMPNQPPKQLSTTWEDVVKTIYEEKSFGAELSKFQYFTGDLKFVLKEAKSDSEKLSKIFTFVKNRMAWNGKYSYTTRKELETVYKDRIGNSAEINLILAAMLKMANIESYPVIISTKSNGVALFPNRTRFNHVIVSVNINNDVLLLDATNKWATINTLPLEDLNGKGRLIKSDGKNHEIDLKPKEFSKNYTVLMAEVTQNAVVSGKIKRMYFHQNALQFRDEYANYSRESHIEALENKYAALEVKDHFVENLQELGRPVTENYTFNSTSMVDVIGNKMYFNPMLFLAQTKNYFLQEKRVYPVNFAFPKHDKYVISVTIPDGYAIESIPAQKVITMPDNLGSYHFTVQKTEKQIQLVIQIEINESEIPSGYYEELKQFFNEIVTSQTEKVVLKKA